MTVIKHEYRVPPVGEFSGCSTEGTHAFPAPPAGHGWKFIKCECEAISVWAINGHDGAGLIRE